MQNKPMFDDLDVANQPVPSRFRVILLICVVGLMITGIVVCGFVKGD